MAAVSYSGLFDRSIGNAGGSYALLVNKSPIRSATRRLVNREEFRAITALFNALIGATTGANVTATHGRLKYLDPVDSTVIGSMMVGGLRPVETITDINRNTTAADVTALKEITFGVARRAVNSGADLSGNGGKSF